MHADRACPMDWYQSDDWTDLVMVGYAVLFACFIYCFLSTILLICSDKISSTNPRVIEDQRARQLCIDVRHSLFYETCATYGFNVDRVFSEGEFLPLTSPTKAQDDRVKSETAAVCFQLLRRLWPRRSRRRCRHASLCPIHPATQEAPHRDRLHSLDR